jgi:rubrerythrin
MLSSLWPPDSSRKGQKAIFKSYPKAIKSFFNHAWIILTMRKGSEKTAFEREFRIDLTAKSLNVSRGIEISLRTERRGRDFYSRNARKIQNMDIKRFIEFLAAEEDRHIALLKELRDSLRKRGAWIDASEDPGIMRGVLEDLRVFRGKAGRDVREAGDVTVVLNALKTEKDLIEFYEKFAHHIRDREGKRFFLKLADWERTHYQLLSGIYEGITFFRMQT